MAKNSVIVTFSMFLFLMLPGYTLAGDYKLPDTGIDKCYDNDSEITCPYPGQPFYGQDAQYDGPQPSYQDNGDGTVTDLNTGLVWQQGDGQNVTRRTWEDALDYCEGLTLAGHSDWRLSNRRELMSIVDYSRENPTIDTQRFSDCRSSNYWSSSTSAFDTNEAWFVSFLSGIVFPHTKATYTYYVRCVRGGPTPAPSFHDNGNGTVSDSGTGLMWQQGDGQNVTRRTWEDALDYCEGLSLGEHSDWRLPNVRELESIVDSDHINPCINTTYFPDCRSSVYWSSSASTSLYATWDVYFWTGHVFDTNRTDQDYVRCVRTEPSISLDIKANGQDGPIAVTPSDPVSIEISLDPGYKAAQNADWWVVENGPDGWSYYDVIGGSWLFLPGLSVTYQGPLFNFASFGVLNTSGLPVGTYSFYFGVDMNVNGLLDFDQLYYDGVVVNVTQ